jgi:phosphonate transport system permease protein
MSSPPVEQEHLAVPWPGHEGRGRPTVGNYLVAASLIALFVWSYHGSEIRPSELFSSEGGGQILAYIKKLFPPDLSPATLQLAFRGAVETFAISFLGTLLAAAIAFSVVFFASRNLMYSGLLYEMEPGAWWKRAFRLGPYLTAKSLLNILRTIPEMVWALIFVFVVGLGPFPGMLALGVHTGGVLGKLFAEVLEDVDPQPIESLQSTGATRMQILFYAIMPQVLPQFISYTLYRWEVNIRVAAVLGFVGAGGLGQRIHIAISLFLENQLLTYLIFIYVLVTIVDYLSAYLRRKAI